MRSAAARRVREAIYGSSVSQALRHGGLLPEAELALVREAATIEPADFQFINSPAAQLAATSKLNLDQLSWLRTLLDPAFSLDINRDYFLKSYLLSTARSYPIIDAILDLAPTFSQVAVEVGIRQGSSNVATIECLNSNIALPVGKYSESLEAVAYLQAAALRKLIALRVRDVFTSSVNQVLTAHDGLKQKFLKNILHKTYGKLVASDLWELFPQWEIPAHLSEQQIKVLSTFGAEITYALMYPSVSLYPLSQHSRLAPPIGYDQIPEVRQAKPTLAETIGPFIASHPGASVAVCADFPQHLSYADFKLQSGEPIINLTEWPQLITSLWWRLPDAAAQAIDRCFDSCKQDYMISQLAQLPMRIFPKIQSAGAALQALPKLVMDDTIMQQADAEMVRDFLFSIEVGGDVHDAIVEAYESRRGVFSKLRYRGALKRRLQRLFGRS